MGHEAGDDEPEFYDEARSTLVSGLQVNAIFWTVNLSAF